MQPVREMVEEILGGGKTAFEMRRKKYGFQTWPLPALNSLRSFATAKTPAQFLGRYLYSGDTCALLLIVTPHAVTQQPASNAQSPPSLAGP